ncbi:MAG: hypothetical protein J0J04_04985 [Microbacterium sp.]|uniref:hypothetical protein n=1 Tax=Microbacterium sp. TaxID=51671 RepID=UPI001AC36269|nr:hypothetical protein [Microbacterium sp.]MBN9214163.1 hypothetical protein [Microbacterium sp.]
MDITTAKVIPVGATLVDAYWAVPTPYGEGPRFDTEDLAITAAVQKMREAIEQHKVARGASYVPLPERITVDLRWRLTYPAGGGVDTVVARKTYESIVEAEESLARHRRFAR